jgi:archaellum component FlaC
MMSTDNNQLTAIASNIETIKVDLAEFKQDFKDIKKDINDLKNSNTKLDTDIGWIKVLFSIGISIMTVLLGSLITLLFMLLRTLSS